MLARVECNNVAISTCLKVRREGMRKSVTQQITQVNVANCHVNSHTESLVHTESLEKVLCDSFVSVWRAGGMQHIQVVFHQ